VILFIYKPPIRVIAPGGATQVSDKIYRNSLGAHAALQLLYQSFTDDRILGEFHPDAMPISDAMVARSGYCERQTIQNAIMSAIIDGGSCKCVIISGNEGVGKSTALQYTIGYEMPKKHSIEYENTFFVIINSSEWGGVRGAAQEFFDKLAMQLRGDVWAKIKDEYDAELRQISGMPYYKVLSRFDAPEDYIKNIFSFLMASGSVEFAHSRVVIVLDNADTIPAIQQKNLFRAVSGLLDAISARAKLLVRRGGRPCSLRVILPLRPETDKQLAATGGAFWPIRVENFVYIDFHRHKDLETFNIFYKKLIAISDKIQLTSAARAALVSSIKIITDDAKVEFDYTETDVPGLIKDLAGWLLREASAREFLYRFSGKSIRKKSILDLRYLAIHRL